jgi:hypothetical protein
MDLVHNTVSDLYRLVVTRRNASEILLLPSGDVWSLPSVEIFREQRIAEQLTAKLQTEWGFQGYCLFTPSLAATDRSPLPAKCAVMEVLNQSDRAPERGCWMPSKLARDQIDRLTEDDSALVKKSFQELASYMRESSSQAFARPGWLGELFEWVQERIDPLGLRLTGDFLQLNASPTFSLIRLETTGSAVWFKATGQPILHELPISVSLAHLFPECTPPLIGIHSSWNGWLSREASGTTLDHFVELPVWNKVADDLAQLQIHSIGKETELLKSQCKDLRLSRLIKQIDPFLARMAELMAAQEKQVPAALTKPELNLLGNDLKEACSLLQDFGFPDTLGHLDLNPGNILVSPERSVFLDWAEGCVTNPLITFEYLREHFGRSRLSDTHAIESIVAAYVHPWQSLFSSDALRQATVISPLVAVFAYAVGTNPWHSSEALLKPSLAGYLRSLTRRMHRETLQIAGRREKCLA